MKRKWIYLNEIEPWDYVHQPDGDWFKITKPDPQNQEEHEEGINYILEKIKDGVKIMPILVQEKDGKYHKLDGFKRYMARKMSGYNSIECFVCEPGDEGKKFNVDGIELVCRSGGQSYLRFPLVEYEEDEDQKDNAGKIVILYKDKDFRIELREAIHIHWGEKGFNRIIMGGKDFKILAEAIINSKI